MLFYVIVIIVIVIVILLLSFIIIIFFYKNCSNFFHFPEFSVFRFFHARQLTLKNIHATA